MRLNRFIAVIILIILALVLSRMITHQIRSNSTASSPALDSAPPKFDKEGVFPGQKYPELKLVDLNGTPADLTALWKEKPLLLLTCSYTCPKSRNQYPNALKLYEEYKDRVNWAIVYVLEAHPVIDPNPYKGFEEVTEANKKDGILCRQPKTLEERLALARKFQELLKIPCPIFVDQMDNAAWKTLGAGPNMGIIVRPGGTVEDRRGWFDAEYAKAALEKYFSTGNP